MMGKKRFGQNIVNWHRSLGANELSRREQRRRNAEPKHVIPSYALCETNTDDWVDPQIHRRRGGYGYDYDHYDEYYYSFIGDETDISDYRLDLLLEQVIQPSGIQFPSGVLADLKLLNPPPVEFAKGTSEFPPDRTNIEERLMSHLAMVRSASGNLNLIRAAIMDSIGDPSNQAVIERELDPECIKLVYLFAPFWVRRPLDWDQSGGDSLIEHLFAIYPVPKFLDKVWRCELSDSLLKWVSWSILFAQGGSLKKAAKKFQWWMPARLSHYLHEVSRDLSAEEATVYAAILYTGGTERDFLRFAQQPAYIVDITSPEHDVSFVKFWHETVRWLIKHGALITDDDGSQILNWAMHKYTESLRSSNNPFSWKKRGVRSALERSREYHERISRYQSTSTWSGHGWDWTWLDERENQWSFVELTSGEELFHEGRAMNHCVGSYASMCANGYSAIVSLRKNRLQRLTIEIRPKSLTIVQARGKYNRNATLEEKHVFSLWHKTIMQNPLEDVLPD